MRFSRLILQLLTLLLPLTASASEPQRLVLWPDGAPGSSEQTEAHQPTLHYYKPDGVTPTGTAVVICPGGGYGHLAKDHEGVEPARFFNQMGVAAYVLHYRLGSNGFRHPIPLQDAQRAIRMVRSRAASTGVDPGRIGIMGFSAGGHLAASTGSHYDAGNGESADPVEQASSRPDFTILCYGVLSFDPAITHAGSVKNLMGDRREDKQLIELLSNEKQVNARTPPAFLFHTANDQAVPAANSLRYYEALLHHKVPAALHLFQDGKHGVGLAKDNPALSLWPSLLQRWMDENGWLKPR